ncbi:hypothetical protein Bsp3421_001093 [Burkholderia sp. FERM BP-3421]|jgi:hypothetical protein|uniref:hypothetical protein n=1 Tax=Burkholderia sp. FERM BP-3421 TaxID=1494466 RepID=UPI002362F5F3|nr:hypothetical protein [Burkholderia sp. FERM BP-3421]WDD91192.1 hypothetical protein Bsp3421_001093 [Burkholderia sp. FERM BP-3421]
MALDSAAFVVHDISRFPLVSVRLDALPPGFAPQWETEMDLLIAQALPFAVIHHGTPLDEGEDERQRRARWLGQRQEALQPLCKVRIFVEFNAARRAAAITRCRAAMHASGVPYRVVATLDEAHAIASHRLATALTTAA